MPNFSMLHWHAGFDGATLFHSTINAKAELKAPRNTVPNVKLISINSN
jgi:hypothetical protein